MILYQGEGEKKLFYILSSLSQPHDLFGASSPYVSMFVCLYVKKLESPVKGFQSKMESKDMKMENLIPAPRRMELED